MNWEHTDIAMAPRAGRIDELRDEATSYRQSRDLLRAKRARRVHALRSRLAASVAAVASLIRPAEQSPVTNIDRAGLSSRVSD